MKGDIVAAAIILAGGLLWAVAMNLYFSPYNQCVRAQTTILSDAETVKFPASLAKVRCAEALGGVTK